METCWPKASEACKGEQPGHTVKGFMVGGMRMNSWPRHPGEEVWGGTAETLRDPSIVFLSLPTPGNTLPCVFLHFSASLA